MKEEGFTRSSLETEGMAYGGGMWQSIIVSLVAEGTRRKRWAGNFIEVFVGRGRQSRVSRLPRFWIG